MKIVDKSYLGSSDEVSLNLFVYFPNVSSIRLCIYMKVESRKQVDKN